MRLLLDTHVLLWLLDRSDSLPASYKQAIDQPANEIYISSVNALEISIKFALGKLLLPKEPRLLIADILEIGDVKHLDMTMERAFVAGALPPHHRDPFDRLLIAQATAEGMTLLSVDPLIAQYEVPILPR